VRLVVARCSVQYEGRLGARLPPAQRLILLKADGSIAVHADSKAYKPLNWMNPPCTIREEPGTIVAANPGGERLTITLHEVLLDLDRQFPGIRFRMVDEHGALRRHMKVFVNDDATRDLATELDERDVLTIMQALSGG